MDVVTLWYQVAAQRCGNMGNVIAQNANRSGKRCFKSREGVKRVTSQSCNDWEWSGGRWYQNGSVKEVLVTKL